MGTTRSKKRPHAQQAATKSFTMELIMISKKVVERRVTNLKEEKGLE